MPNTTKKDSPGVYVPPPLFYVACFFISVGLQRWVPLGLGHLRGPMAVMAGSVLITAGVVAVLPALVQFLRTRNTLVLILPARSLQTTGIYSFTRNPMYLGLLLIYTGLALDVGNWWTIILLPLLIVVVDRLIIRKEESYLVRAFGPAFTDYCARVRKWI